MIRCGSEANRHEDIMHWSFFVLVSPKILRCTDRESVTHTCDLELLSVLLVVIRAFVAWLKTLDPQVIWTSVRLMIH